MKELPISEYQKRFFLEWILDPESSAYNLGFAYKIKGDLKRSTLKKACDIFIQKNEVAYSCYNKDGTVCNQLDFNIEDIYQECILDENKLLDEEIVNFFNIPFDLIKGPLVRFYLIQEESCPNLYYFLVVSHHIIADAIAADIMVNEISYFYNTLLENLEPNTATPKTFTQAVTAEQSMFVEKEEKEAKEFWESYLADWPLNVTFPFKNNTSIHNNSYSHAIYFELTPDQSAKIKQLAKQCESTVFIVVAAIYSILLGRYSNQDKVVISYPVNLRPAGFAKVTGCFVNNVPLCVETEKFETLGNVIKNITQHRKNIKKHQRYSLTNIINDQRLMRKEGNTSVFNIGLVEANLNITPIQLNNLEVDVFNVSNHAKRIYDICLKFDPRDSSIFKFGLEYCPYSTDSSLIESFIQSFNKLVDVSSESLKLSDFCVLNNLDYEKIVYSWNKTEKDFAINKPVHVLFEEQVANNPEKIAVIHKNCQLTYKELNSRVNQLANYLDANYDIQKEDLVALYLNRSEDTVITILALIKLGAAYVPMDPNYPEDRIAYILEDTQASIVLTQETCLEKLMACYSKLKDDPLNCIQMIAIDSPEICSKLSLQSLNNPIHNVALNNLMYIIYTSGTTGAPKGVMVEHGNVLNLILSLSGKYSLQANSERILLFSNYVFDVSVEQIFLALTNGCALIIPTREEIDNQDKLIDLIQSYEVTHFGSTPHYLEYLDYSRLTSLRRLISAGDHLSSELYNKFKIYVNQVVNEYGPTEATVISLMSEDGKGIGRPLDNYTAYVLDSHLQPLPIGVIGELYIGGLGVAREYLNKPELTEERFISNPFQTANEKKYKRNAKLYKTGDLVKYNSDGNIEYICRNDTQVKIGGIRIELGEIETALNGYKGVQQSVVLAKSRAVTETAIDDPSNLKTSRLNKYLVAYYVAPYALNEEDILNYLSSKLPVHMLPQVFIHLDKLPLNVNGKLDVNALPVVEFLDRREFVPPSNKEEKQIACMFGEILGLDSSCIGINDDFFKLGGSSILVIKLINLLQQDCNIQLSFAEIFEAKTVKNIALLVRHPEKNKYQPLVQLNNAVDRPLLFMPHPAGAGCETYLELATALTEYNLCYGIDNYNQYHTEPLAIDDLVAYYLKAIQERFQLNQNEPIKFLGWSYGGLLSLKIASLLEKQGYKNITVYLLDSAILDKKLKTILKKADINEVKRRVYNYLVSVYGNIDYVYKILDNTMLEIQSCSEVKLDVLLHTKPVLLKAIPDLLDTRFGEDEIIDESSLYVKNLKYNNLEKYVKNKSQITVFNMPGHIHHGNILQYTDFIIKCMFYNGEGLYKSSRKVASEA